MIETDEDDEYYGLTEQGLYAAMEMHQKFLDGWTIEQVAVYYDKTVLAVQVMLAMFYHAAEACDVDLGVYVPDTVEGLDG
jgi:hypothetical protein